MRKQITILAVLILILVMAPSAQGLVLNPWACVVAEEEGWPVGLTFYCLVQIMMEGIDDEDDDGWQWGAVTPTNNDDKEAIDLDAPLADFTKAVGEWRNKIEEACRLYERRGV